LEADLLDVTDDPDPNVRWAACWGQWSRGIRTPALRRGLVSAFSDPDFSGDTESALYDLMKIEPLDAAVVQMFLDHLWHDRRKVRDAAEIGVSRALRAERAHWLARTEHAELAKRIRALETLGRLAPDADVLTALITGCRDAAPIVRGTAAASLGQLGLALVAERADLRPALKALVETVSDRDDGVRRAAVGALSGLGDVARPAWPALRRLLKQGHEGASKAAAEVLGADATLGSAERREDAEEDWLDDLTERLSGHRPRRPAG
jgi:HEAT repeat protein